MSSFLADFFLENIVDYNSSNSSSEQDTTVNFTRKKIPKSSRKRKLVTPTDTSSISFCVDEFLTKLESDTENLVKKLKTEKEQLQTSQLDQQESSESKNEGQKGQKDLTSDLKNAQKSPQKVNFLGSHWHQVQANNETYFWNEKTDEVSWEPPEISKFVDQETQTETEVQSNESQGHRIDSDMELEEATPKSKSKPISTLLNRAKICLHKLNNLIDQPHILSPQKLREIQFRTRLLDFKARKLPENHFLEYLVKLEKDLIFYETKILNQNYEIRYDYRQKLYFYTDQTGREFDYFPGENIPDFTGFDVIELD